jgi:hypothetical protein
VGQARTLRIGTCGPALKPMPQPLVDGSEAAQ